MVPCFKIEAVVQRCSVKTVFLKIWENSQENTCVRVSFLIKLEASVPVNIVKFLRTPILKKQLLLFRNFLFNLQTIAYDRQSVILEGKMVLKNKDKDKITT